MDKHIVAHTSTVDKTMNEASIAEQIEFDLLDALSKLHSIKDRISKLGMESRGELALKLADTQGTLLYAIKETEEAVAHYSIAEGLLVAESAPDVVEFAKAWDANSEAAQTIANAA